MLDVTVRVNSVFLKQPKPCVPGRRFGMQFCKDFLIQQKVFLKLDQRTVPAHFRHLMNRIGWRDNEDIRRIGEVRVLLQYTDVEINIDQPFHAVIVLYV